MKLVKNINLGKSNYYFKIILVFFILFIYSPFSVGSILEGKYTEIKVLDKISSKNTLIKLKNNKEFKFDDLIIKSLKCKNSEFDDNPEITAYIQVTDSRRKNNDEVYVFNNWMFSSSPSINPFDHPIYDLRLIKCY